MEIKKLNFEDFRENQLTRNQTTKISGGIPPPPPPEVDEDGNIVPPGSGSGNGDTKP